MPWINAALSVMLTYGFLCLATLLLWAPKSDKAPWWGVALAVAVLFGLLSATLSAVAVLVIMILAHSLYVSQNEQYPMLAQVLSSVAVFILGVGIMRHYIPGFSNFLALNKILITPDAVPFSMYLNFDKAALGILILGFLHQRIQTRKQWSDMVKAAYQPALITIALILVSSYIFHFVHFEPKLPESLGLFALNNLLFVCLAEEAFFRGFIQKYLIFALRHVKHGSLISIVIAASLFGAAHFTGGLTYVILATIAGIGYGWIYFGTQRIEASILTHFSLNILHFIFFTYPALA